MLSLFGKQFIHRFSSGATPACSVLWSDRNGTPIRPEFWREKQFRFREKLRLLLLFLHDATACPYVVLCGTMCLCFDSKSFVRFLEHFCSTTRRDGGAIEVEKIFHPMVVVANWNCFFASLCAACRFVCLCQVVCSSICHYTSVCLAGGR